MHFLKHFVTFCIRNLSNSINLLNIIFQLWELWEVLWFCIRSLFESLTLYCIKLLRELAKRRKSQTHFAHQIIPHLIMPMQIFPHYSVPIRVNNDQTWKKLIFVHKPIFVVEKCPQIHMIHKHIKVLKMTILSIISDIFWQKWINRG